MGLLSRDRCCEAAQRSDALKLTVHCDTTLSCPNMSTPLSDACANSAADGIDHRQRQQRRACWNRRRRHLRHCVSVNTDPVTGPPTAAGPSPHCQWLRRWQVTQVAVTIQLGVARVSAAVGGDGRTCHALLLTVIDLATRACL